MLAISDTTLQAMRAYATPGFTRRLDAILGDESPQLLPWFPSPVRLQIVANMVSRAARWGLGYQDAIHAFCRAMIEIGANFDECPPIAARLRAEPGLDTDFPELIAALPPELQREAARSASVLPFFVPDRMRDAPLAERTAAAIVLALHDRPDAGAPAASAAAGVGQAQALGLAGLPDAPLVCAAARSLWGDGFAASAWFRDSVREGWPPAGLLELIRLRLALEFGRFI